MGKRNSKGKPKSTGQRKSIVKTTITRDERQNFVPFVCGNCSKAIKGDENKISGHRINCKKEQEMLEYEKKAKEKKIANQGPGNKKRSKWGAGSKSKRAANH